MVVVGGLLLAVAFHAGAQEAALHVELSPTEKHLRELRAEQEWRVAQLQAEELRVAIKLRETELEAAKNRASDMAATRYEVVPSSREGASPTLYAINQNTGEVAQRRGNEWVSIVKKLDWDSIRTLDEVQQEERENQDKAQEAWDTEEAARKAKNEALRDDFLKTIPQTPLAELVAMADDISIVYRDEQAYWNERPKQNGQLVPSRGRSRSSGAPTGFPQMKVGAFLVKFEAPLKGLEVAAPRPLTPRPPEATRPGLNEGKITFYLSHTSPDNKTVFPAPETIVEDVKAEIKRQAEEQ